MDKESNLADHGVRKYENEVGVFTSIDPLWEQYRGWSPYHYAGNNPITFIDESGLSQRDPNEDPNILPGQDKEEMDYDGTHFMYTNGKWKNAVAVKKENSISKQSIEASIVYGIGFSASLERISVNNESDISLNLNFKFGFDIGIGGTITNKVIYDGNSKLTISDIYNQNNLIEASVTIGKGNSKNAVGVGPYWNYAKINGYNINYIGESIGGKFEYSIYSKDLIKLSLTDTFNKAISQIKSVFYIPNIKPY